MSNKVFQFLPAYNTLTVVTNSLSSGRYSFHIPGLQDTGVTTISISSTYVIGPFSTPKSIRFDWDKGEGSYTLSPESPFNSSVVAITGGTIAGVAISASTGTFTQTGLAITDAGTHTLQIKNNETLTGNKTLSLVTGNANRSLTLTGDASIVGTNTGDQTIGTIATQNANAVAFTGGTITGIEFLVTGSQLAKITALGNSATGTEIATAVNAIITALIGIGAIAAT